MRLLAIVVVPALVLAVPSAGCAALGAKAPDPNRSDWEKPVCNTGRGAVGVDATLAVALGVGGIAVADESSTGSALLFLIAGAYTISAISANGSANRCRIAQEEYAVFQRDEASMGGLAVAPQPRPADAAHVGPGAQPMPTPPATVTPAAPVRPTPPNPQPPKSTPPPADETYPEPADGDGDDKAEADAAPDPDDSGNPWHAFWHEVP